MLRKSYIATFIVGIALVGAAVVNVVNNQSTQSPTATIYADVPIGTASLTLSPATTTVKQGQEFKVMIDLSTGQATDASSGVDIIATYDPTVLEVVDTDPTTAGVQISSGNLFDFSPANDVVLAKGIINFSASQQPTNKPVSITNGTLATITFKAKSLGQSSIALQHTPGSVSDTNVIKAGEGRDLLSRVTNATVKVTQ